MKQWWIIILLLIQTNLWAQEDEIKEITAYPNPTIIVNWNYNSWYNTPSEINISPLSMGVDIYKMFPVFGKESFFSFAIGSGISVQNIKSDIYLDLNDGATILQKIPNELKYSSNKISTVFVDIPLEIRLRNRPHAPKKGGVIRKRNFRFALGFKIGYILQRYIKYDGQDYRNFNYGNYIKFKEYRIPNVLKYRYGVYFRGGYGKFALTAFYALSPFFEKNKSYTLYPFSIGLSINI
jgi:hypothetical protein